MREFQVWKTIVDWIEDHGGKVIATCPPGSSVYGYHTFRLIDPITSKRDEPDILFIWNGSIYFVECKPTLRGICAKGRKAGSTESDIDKLRRIEKAYQAKRYNRQLYDNYGIDTNKYSMRIGIGYSSNKDSFSPITGITQFIVSEDFKVKIVG